MSTSPKRLHSISAVVVVDESVPAREILESLARVVSVLADDGEILIVANGVSALVASELSKLMSILPDTTVHFLAERVDSDVATLVGFDRALGDILVVLSPTPSELEILPALIAEAETNEVVFAVPSGESVRSVHHLAGQLFFKIYQALVGASIVWPTPRLRIYSRAAARYLASRLDGPFLMKSVHVRGAFPGITVPVTRLEHRVSARGFSGSLKKAFRNVISASTVPLRLAISFAGLGALMAVVEIAYVIFVNATRSDIQPGWTTLSLLIASMMFVFSVLLALLTSYILAMYTTIQPRSRIPVIRELRSRNRRNVDRLNVLGEDGHFKLGASGVNIPVVRPDEVQSA